MAADLSPCPFCGGTAERIDIEDGENAGGSCISCTVCQASSNVEFEFKENFVSNWNRRAEGPEPRVVDLSPLAAWMTAQGFATGHGDNLADMVRELEVQYAAGPGGAGE